MTTTPRPALREARAGFGAGRGYLAACTLGLPLRASLDALRTDLERWALAEVSPGHYDAVIAEAREAYGQLVGLPADRIAIGSQAAAQCAIVAASVPDGARVICAEGDFSSIVFPFLQQAHRRVRVEHAPLGALADRIDDDTWLAAYSLVQSATGEIADADRIRASAEVHCTHVLCDTTQAAGWLPVDASRFDATICHSYKWLCAPRGVSFLTVSEEFGRLLRPIEANWYAGEDPWASCYGPQLRLADGARRFDVSPAWQAWVGALPALRLFAGLDIDEVRAWDAGLGDLLCDGLGLERRAQAIVTWPDPEGRDLRRLGDAGITASGRAGRARVAFHLWNDEEDVERALAALRR